MYFVMLEASPKPLHPAYGKTDGAFAAVFVNESVHAAAEAAATAFVEEHGWDVIEVNEAYPVEIDQYPVGDSSRDHFEQALLDGVVATFNTWPVGAPEDEPT